MSAYLSHPTLVVDVKAVVANWRRFRALAPHSEVGGVLKSDAYGLGAVMLGQALYRAGCRTFFCTTLPEAELLLTALPVTAEVNVAILSGLLPNTLTDYASDSRLLPVLNTPEQMQQWRQSGLGTQNNAYIHVDTGMNRLGIRLADWSSLAADIDFPVRALMSHLVDADDADSSLPEQQRVRFFALDNSQGYRRSLANSAAGFLGEQFHADLLRPGIALYGGNPIPKRHDITLEQCVRLDAPILQIRNVPKGETVGYGSSYTCAHNSRIATVGIGYNEGLPRTLSNHDHFCGWWQETPLPIRGRISMDSLALDITASPDIPPDAWISFLGTQQTLDDLARACDTLAHEALTRLGGRLQRTYNNV